MTMKILAALFLATVAAAAEPAPVYVRGRTDFCLMATYGSCVQTDIRHFALLTALALNLKRIVAARRRPWRGHRLSLRTCPSISFCGPRRCATIRRGSILGACQPVISLN
jgi:hypothetical protein